MRPSSVVIGDTELARRLYAGRYADILAASIDSEAAGCAAEDAAFVVGALSFVGRVEEAELLLENQRRLRTCAARTLGAGGFFLTVAYARSGDFARAERTLVRAYRETSGRRDAWIRSFFCQAIACCHYFAAKYARAAQAALNAQGSAMQARFAYVQMLATDMRANVLAQRGELEEGLRLLEQARNHARHLGFDVNVRVIEASIALERARVHHPNDARSELENLLEDTDIQDSYSRRLLLCALAKGHALVGRGEAARRALEEATRLATRDPRAQASLACARAEVMRVVGGWDAARPHLEQARHIANSVSDPLLKAEVAGLELGYASFVNDENLGRSAMRELDELFARHRLSRAASWLYLYGREQHLYDLDADEFSRVLRPIVGTSRAGSESKEATQAVLRTELWGLIAEACGLAPARRVHLFDDVEVLEAEGDVHPLANLPPRGRSVLTALGRLTSSGRPLSKEALLATVWGINDYRPERHDSLVKTTISRLRAALGRDRMWIETIEGGYAMAAGISVVTHQYELVIEPTSLDELIERVEVSTLREPPAAERARATRWARLAQELAESETLSVGELALRVRASVRTVSRDLSEMHRQALLERVGEGRGTKYRARRATPSSEAKQGARS
jgi:DNA-binding winged helix-turn-helix (wHTH) protein/tetratricopeptide (TPR) repeat protein